MLIHTALGRVHRAIAYSHDLRRADRNVAVVLARSERPEETVLVLWQGGLVQVRFGRVELPLDVFGGAGAVGREDVVEVL